MPKRKTTILLLIGLPLAFFAGLKCQKNLTQIDEIGEPLLTTIKLPNEKLKDTVYLVTKRWGLTGDHQVFALTNTKPSDNHWQPNTSADLIWKGDNIIFYQQQKDTIKIFTLQLPDKTQEIQTKQVIQVNQIDGAAFQRLRKQADTALKMVQ